jgi:hypothetical protein
LVKSRGPPFAFDRFNAVDAIVYNIRMFSLLASACIFGYFCSLISGLSEETQRAFLKVYASFSLLLAMSSNDKSRGKHSKDQKSTAKSGSSAQATVSTEVEPQNLGFLYTIDALDVAYDDKHPERMLMLGGKTGNDVAHFWFPPNRAKMFKRRNGNLYRWRAEETQLVEDIQRPEKKVEVASVFFQVRTDNFLAVFKDCAKYNISEEDIGWSQVGFHHNPGLVSEVDLAGQYDQLAASADGSSWLPQVIPGVYNYDRNPAAKRVGKSGGLCGRLSLLIAMAAFSAEESFAENVVSKCFRHGVWKKHQFETGVGRMSNSPYSKIIAWLIWCRIQKSRGRGVNILGSGS